MPFFAAVITVMLAFSANLSAQKNSDRFLDETDRFLQKYVDNGRVNYRAVKENSQELQHLIETIATLDPAAFSKPEEEQAFLINAYNLSAIYAVAERYPIHSPRDVGGFFNRRKHRVAAKSLTLDDIEKKKLLQKYRDARFHFALVCAAKGCPQIMVNAYRGELLERQLNQRARETLNDPYYLRVDHDNQTAFVSEIFRWYREDFTQEVNSIIQYINQFRGEKIPEHYKISYLSYDWALNDAGKAAAENLPWSGVNLQAYTPSALLRPGEFELKIFNNLYTQTAFFNEDGDRQEQNTRSVFFSGIFNFLLGVRPDVNIGVDVYLKSVKYDDASASPFALFANSAGASSRTEFTHIGPKIKISPFRALNRLAIQSTLLIPLASDLDGGENNEKPFLDINGIQWWNQFFYDYPFLNDFLAYLELGLFFRFDPQYRDFFTPLKAFLNYYPSDNWTLYLASELTPSWDGFSWSSYYGQLGLGLKYQIIKNLELEVLYTNFLIGKNQGAGETFNLGFRLVR
jgi:hypothetical protein